MDYLVEENSPDRPLPGFRLSKLEIYNWGTFDGAVYSVQPRGQTTLVVGENGSGKSTIVDALLTLLVRPQTRNYNVAAGAQKNERDERTYIRGAYDRTIGPDGRPQIQYLRSGHGHYSVLLASFTNQACGSSFTLAQVLHLNSDLSVAKVYAFADGERGIVEDFSELGTSASVAKALRDRGFQTTTSYKQYFAWLQRKTGFRAKAMDIFNQTVAVKDVQRLDLFIRQHMLEPKPWKERVDRLLSHFTELSEAHRLLIRVRQQEELLRPIVDVGTRHREISHRFQLAKAKLDAVSLYFASETIHLLKPWCDKWTDQINQMSKDIRNLESVQTRLREESTRMTVDIETAGGDRLRQLPTLIAQAEQLAAIKLQTRSQFESQLQAAGLNIKLTSPDQFNKLRQQISARREALLSERKRVRQSYDAINHELNRLCQLRDEERREFQTLSGRGNNLPESLVWLRNRLCSELNLNPEELPFAAELMAVSKEELDWESTIELVLSGFSRSLLVPSLHYARVSAYVDATRLTDAGGRGQRLVYLHVAPRSQVRSGQQSNRDTLWSKLVFRSEHPLAGWVEQEVRERFDYLACESVDEFQRAKRSAMTRNRHVKSGGSRHEKDDRTPADRRQYVLGWDNRQKRIELEQSLSDLDVRISQLESQSLQLSTEIDHCSGLIQSLSQSQKVESFEALDHGFHELEASKLRQQKQDLETSNDVVQHLMTLRDGLLAEAQGHSSDRDDLIAKRTRMQEELKSGQSMLQRALRMLEQAKDNEKLATAQSHFVALKQEIAPPLTLENLGTLPQAVTQQLRERLDEAQDQLQPLARELISHMTRFLKKFPDEQADLDANVDSLSSFEGLHTRIIQDELPGQEQRFKRRLNENVLNEIGLLHGALEDERQEIRERIGQLNAALRLLEWKPGTFMQLELSDVTDREIVEFRRELAACLTGSMDGTAVANEATFVKIEKLIAKMRDDSNERWRQKVVDVRNWFNFAAREIVKATDQSRSYYDGGAGQSGGEKGKLAFLVLVAAIAYQYDLDPDARESQRFHFVMVDEMFSRSDDQHAEYALELFEQFGLQLLIVAPLDSKVRVTEPYVGTYLHVVKNKQTNRSDLFSITAESLPEGVDKT